MTRVNLSYDSKAHMREDLASEVSNTCTDTCVAHWLDPRATPNRPERHLIIPPTVTPLGHTSPHRLHPIGRSICLGEVLRWFGGGSSLSTLRALTEATIPLVTPGKEPTVHTTGRLLPLSFAR